MQAAGQYGEVPQYPASRVGAPSNGHMLNLSHEMSLSSSPTPSQAHGHGHGLGLCNSPSAYSQASQSHIQPQVALESSIQSSVLQSQHPQQQQQQRVQQGFNMSMGGESPRTQSATSHPPSHPPQSIPPLQSAAAAAAAVAVDIRQHQHQHQQLHQIQQAAAHDLGSQQLPKILVQQGTSGNPIQLLRPKVELNGSTAGPGIAPSKQSEGLGATPEATMTMTREDQMDGDEVDEEGERGSGGNRWPRQEALALLKLRSEMDAAFRDSSLKGPLWEAISRKLAEMGYHRSAKKCKEKFENVHKYYKRTKEGKTGRQDGKSYRFFTQLEALYGKGGDGSSLINLNNSQSSKPHSNNISAFGINNVAHPGGLLISINRENPIGLITTANHSSLHNNLSSSSISAPFPLASLPPLNASSAAAATAATNAHIARTLERVESMKPVPQLNNTSPHCFLDSSDDDDDDDNDDDVDEDDNDDDDEPGAHESAVPASQNPPRGKKRKRKSMKTYLVFFEKILKKVLDRQEHMQQKFLEALERRDNDRMAREEAWKRQEMVRLNRENDVRAAEQALSASRDASLVNFLQTMTGQSVVLPHHSSGTPVHINHHHQHSTAIVPADYMQNESNADRDPYDPSSKRWPKPEVLALIKLRTSLDQRFHEPGSKAVLWEEISAGMTSQGYARAAKRCKEKWENINKYFKKAKESNKMRPENAKTCPYFHHLNALYKEGLLGHGGAGSSISSKHLMVTEKSEEHSDDVMDQGVNTSKYIGEELGQVQEGDSVMLPAGNGINGSGLSSPTPPANVSAIDSTTISIITPASLNFMANSTTSDTKMHLFMGNERADMKDYAGVMKPSGDIMPMQPAVNVAAAGPRPHALTSSLPFNLDQAMSSSRSSPSGPAVKQ